VLQIRLTYCQIDNALVKKQLIINQGVDQTILMMDRSKAVKEMTDATLQNVRQCYALNERSANGIRLGYGYGGGLSQSHQPGFKGTPRMKTDIEFQIKYVLHEDEVTWNANFLQLPA